MSAVAIELVILALLILTNGTLALAEMAIVSARKARLEQRAQAGDRGARVALELSTNPTRFLSTIQIGITLVGILAGAFGGATLNRVLTEQLSRVPFLAPYANPLSLGIIVIAITYLTLIFGELVPKRLALHQPETLAAMVARPLTILLRLTTPMVTLLTVSTEFVLRLLGTKPSQEAPITAEEITVLLEQGREAGVFDRTEQRLVERIFELGERRASSLMSPRPEIVWIDASAPPDEVLRVVVTEGHTTYPVCRGSVDDVVGTVPAHEILRRAVAGERWDLLALTKPAVFVPDSVDAFRLLELLQLQRSSMAVVVDEHGGVEGVVTMTDLLAAVVGDIGTTPGDVDQDIVHRPDGSLLVDGSLPIEQLREVVEIDNLVPDGPREYNTVGGLVMQKLGRIPVAGDRLQLGNYELEVMDMDGRRVDAILVTPRAGTHDGSEPTS